MQEQKIAYEPHPCSPERKQELRDKGYKIIDAQFAPDDYKHPEPIKTGKPDKKAPETGPASESK